MGIYVDGMFFRCSGVGRVYENLLDAFAGRSEIGEIHTVVPAVQKDHFIERFRDPAIKPVFVGYGPMSAGDLFLKSSVLRSMKDSVRLFFFPSHNIPLSVPGKYVVTVNDVTVFSESFELPAPLKAGFRWMLGRALRGAEDIVTISAAVRRELVKEFRVPAENVRVIYPWVRDEFFLPPPEGAPPVEGEYILYLGLRIAHKNVGGVLGAFGILADEFPSLKLVIAGARYADPDMVDRWKESSPHANRIVEVTGPTDDMIRRLFAGARAFVFPSFAEGFGLPPLEAMAAGVPVACSDIAVFREVYGTAARFVDPASPVSIAAGLRELLADPLLSDSFRKRGRERAAMYRRERSIGSYLDMFD